MLRATVKLGKGSGLVGLASIGIATTARLHGGSPFVYLERMDLMRAEEIEELMAYFTPEEREDFLRLLATDTRLFKPQPGPQLDAWESLADDLGFGGAGGGGKSFLVCGLALCAHQRSLIVRREKVQTEKFVQDFEKVLGNTDGYNSQKSYWKHEGRLIRFAGLDQVSDHRKQQGVDDDLKAFDEATEMREFQVRFIQGWNRTDIPGQRVRNIKTFNPPTTAEGRWIIPYYGPWLDKKWPKRAAPGELLYFATIGGRVDVEVPDHRPFVIHEASGERIYDFDPADYKGAKKTKIIEPKSRTFIPSRVTDNPFYMATGYISTLQQLPEPLRSQMLDGDFDAGVEDDERQLIPTAWVEAAMARWKPREEKGPMDSMGVDVSRSSMGGTSGGPGGKDRTVISRRHGTWFDDLISLRGLKAEDGPSVAGAVIQRRRDNAPVHIDIVGVGTSPYDFLNTNHVQVIGVNGGAASQGYDKSGLLKFANLRSELYWRVREGLDPTNPHPWYLPDDAELLADLTAPRWWLTPQGIMVEPKRGKPTPDGRATGLVARLGRSPDRGDAIVYAAITTPRRNMVFSGYIGHSAPNSDRYDELKG